MEALEELSGRWDIVINLSDKGSVVVIMDKPQYVQEGLRQLEDGEFYSKLTAPIFQDSVPHIEWVVHSLFHEGFICQQQASYC